MQEYDEILAEEEPKPIFNPITFVLEFLASYGWYLLGVAAVLVYVAHRLRPAYLRWKQDREDAEYHKDPDVALARMEAVQRAREKQQQMLAAASVRAAELQREREEKKRQEALERLEKYGSAAQSRGRRLGSSADADVDADGFLPLSGGASTSSYRPPKRSACAKGGCGR